MRNLTLAGAIRPVLARADEVVETPGQFTCSVRITLPRPARVTVMKELPPGGITPMPRGNQP